MYKPKSSYFHSMPKPQNDLKSIAIYTDGCCVNNPGIGGWGAILIYNGKKKEICGGNAQTTNNRMELTAVIQALSILKEKCDVTIYSDSKYVIEAFNSSWITKWRQNSWRKGNDFIKNVDLWKELYRLSLQHEITWVWVKGHNGDPNNERADKLAFLGLKKL